MSEQIPCACCHEPLGTQPALKCKGCGADYHRSCRLGLGRCPNDACPRSKQIHATTERRPKNVLDRNVDDLFAPSHDWAGRPQVSLGIGILLIAAVIGILLGQAIFS